MLFSFVGAAYAVLGGLRAVAISDTYSGVLLLSLGMLVVYLSIDAINWDFSGIPADRLTLIGGDDSPIPWHTLLTGMLFIQIFYWGTNQTITQRAMASPTVAEGQKGVYAAAIIRLLVVPPLIVLPGIVSYKLYGDIGDAAYGQIVGDVLPMWLSGAFAAALAAAVLTTFNSILNSSSALYVCDIHERYFANKSKKLNVARLNLYVTVVFIALALLMVPVYSSSESIINTIQTLYGLLSMPILSCFIVALLFKNAHYVSALFAVVFGVLLYALFTFQIQPFGLHYIHLMFITLISTVLFALLVNRVLFKEFPQFSLEVFRTKA
jgi:SSS family solute:Na+ symporter